MFISLLLIAVLSLCSCHSAFAVYDGEILFRDISWDTDIVTFKEKMASEVIHSRFSNTIDEQPYIFCFDETEEHFYSTYSFNDNGNCAFSVNITPKDSFYVAGWPVLYICADAIHKVENRIVLRDPSDSRIVRCMYSFKRSEIADGNLALENVKEKLVGLYGDVYLTKKTDDAFDSTTYIWLGENTYIELAAEIYKEDNSLILFTLTYGITNTLDLLNEIENCESIIDFSSTDGL